LPHTNRRRALIVIDMQPAFIKQHNTHLVPNIVSLIKQVPYDAYIEAVFHTEAGSLWDRQQDYVCPLDDTTHTVDDIRAALEPHHPLQVAKETRSVFKGDQDIEAYLAQHYIEEVHIVGTETHDCVLATAYSAFDAGFPTYILEECCESGTPGRHADGLKLLRYQSMTNNSCRAATINVAL
jgi:nicotinamidase-related amidase